MKVNIRPETKLDHKRIHEVVARAFGRENEAKLVDALRKTRKFVPGLSLAAWYYEHIVGYILFYPIEIVNAGKRSESLALAPVAVDPDHQKKGIGEKLIRVGLSKVKKLGYASVIVIGHAAYYPRFGFERASTWHIKAGFDVPDEALMAQELSPGALSHAAGTVVYPGEFSKV